MMRPHPLLVPRSRRGLWALRAAVLLGATAAGFQILQLWLVATLLAGTLVEPRHGVASSWVGWIALAVVSASRAACLWASESLAAVAGAHVRRQLRARFLSRLHAFGPTFVSGERTGDLAHTLTGGIETTDAYVTQYLPQVVLAVAVPVTVATVVAVVDPLSAVVLALTGPLIPLFMVLIGRTAAARTKLQWRVLSHASARFLDALQGVMTLKALQRTDDEARRLGEISERFRIVTMGVLRIAFLSALVLEGLATISTAVIAVEVGLRVLYAHLDYRSALFVLLLAPEFYRPLRALGASFHASLSGSEAAQRIEEIVGPEGDHEVNAPFNEPQRVTVARPPRRPERLRFEHVTFGYHADRPPVLRDLAFDVAPGSMLAIVGASGAGKSTVLQLLLGFVAPGAGWIAVGERRLGEVDWDEWRTGVAWVPQRPHVFAGSVGENLRLARPEASATDVQRAIDLTGLTDVIDALPKGLDTPIGEFGTRLSGGQIQRLAIARAMLKDAPYLLLDEPTSQLDAATERDVLAGVNAFRGASTIVLVTHRITTARFADEILVVSAGAIAERGTHSNLIAAGGRYARMVAAAAGAL